MTCHATQNVRLLAYLGIMNLWQRVAELELPKNGGHKFDRRYIDLPDGGRRLQYWLRQGKQKRAA